MIITYNVKFIKLLNINNLSEVTAEQRVLQMYLTELIIKFHETSRFSRAVVHKYLFIRTMRYLNFKLYKKTRK